MREPDPTTLRVAELLTNHGWSLTWEPAVLAGMEGMTIRIEQLPEAAIQVYHWQADSGAELLQTLLEWLERVETYQAQKGIAI